MSQSISRYLRSLQSTEESSHTNVYDADIALGVVIGFIVIFSLVIIGYCLSREEIQHEPAFKPIDMKKKTKPAEIKALDPPEGTFAKKGLSSKIKESDESMLTAETQKATVIIDQYNEHDDDSVSLPPEKVEKYKPKDLPAIKEHTSGKINNSGISLYSRVTELQQNTTANSSVNVTPQKYFPVRQEASPYSQRNAFHSAESNVEFIQPEFESQTLPRTNTPPYQQQPYAQYGQHQQQQVQPSSSNSGGINPRYGNESFYAYSSTSPRDPPHGNSPTEFRRYGVPQENGRTSSGGSQEFRVTYGEGTRTGSGGSQEFRAAGAGGRTGSAGSSEFRQYSDRRVPSGGAGDFRQHEMQGSVMQQQQQLMGARTNSGNTQDFRYTNQNGQQQQQQYSPPQQQQHQYTQQYAQQVPYNNTSPRVPVLPVHGIGRQMSAYEMVQQQQRQIMTAQQQQQQQQQQAPDSSRRGGERFV